MLTKLHFKQISGASGNGGGSGKAPAKNLDKGNGKDKEKGKGKDKEDPSRESGRGSGGGKDKNPQPSTSTSSPPPTEYNRAIVFIMAEGRAGYKFHAYNYAQLKFPQTYAYGAMDDEERLDVYTMEGLIYTDPTPYAIFAKVDKGKKN